jgi:aspartokinase/homoserine dehydrogenase 1
MLIKASELALQGDEAYIIMINEIESRHSEALSSLFGNNKNSSRDFLSGQIRQLSDTLKGVYMLNDLSDKSLARIVSIGEILSSFIVTEAMRLNGLQAVLQDSRSLIKTDSNYSNAAVDYPQTYKNIRDFLPLTIKTTPQP